MKRFVLASLKALPPSVRKSLEKIATPVTGSIARRGVKATDTALSWTKLQRKSVSIVIPSYNDFTLISACIKSIKATCSSFDYEIIVVDDYCQPENTAKLLTLNSADCRVILKEQRGGFAVTVNVGMAAATKEDIVLLNSDTVALPGWLDELQYAAHGIDPSIGLVSPKLLYPSGRIQYGGTFHARDIAPQWFAHLHAGKWSTHPDGNVPGYIFGISGACMYTTRFAYDQLGGLDESYWLGFEDVDYAMEAWTRGIRCYYRPQAVLFHHESASRGYSQGKRELRSLRYFWRKWSALFESTKTAPARPVIVFVASADGASDGWNNHIAALQNIAAEEGYVVRSIDPTRVNSRSDQSSENHTSSIKISCDHDSSETVWLESVTSNPAVRLISENSLRQVQVSAEQKALLKPEFYFVSSTEPQATLLNRVTPWKSKAVVVPLSSGVSSKPSPGNANKIIVLTSGQQPDTKLFPLGATVDIRSVVSISNRLCKEIVDGDYGLIVNLRNDLTAEEFNQITTLGAALISLKSDGLELIALDGFNCLLIENSDASLRERVNDLTGDSKIIEEFTTNAWNSYESLIIQSQNSFVSLLSSLTRVE